MAVAHDRTKSHVPIPDRARILMKHLPKCPNAWISLVYPDTAILPTKTSGASSLVRLSRAARIATPPPNIHSCHGGRDMD